MNSKPLIAASTLLGIGMGGFVDGILFHQIFQIHSMLVNTRQCDPLSPEQCDPLRTFSKNGSIEA